MKVEREIAEFALPFAVGIATAMSVTWPPCHLVPIPYALVPAAALIPALCLIHPWHRQQPGHVVHILMVLSAFFCGMTTGLTHKAMMVSTLTTPGIIGEFALQMGERMKSAINGLPFRNKETNALINALLTGDRSGIPPDITHMFRESGAAHILALSGLHLGIIYGIVHKVLSFAGNTKTARRVRSITILAICGFYTLATGAGPSIVRAFIFIAAGEAASLAGRFRSTANTLYISIIFQLAASPAAINSVSFQLSYAAMAGIAFIYPYLRDLWPGFSDKGLIEKIWSSASMSIACQLTTGPLAWIYFRSLPIYFLLTNLIAIPLTGLIIPAALMTVIMDLLGICPGIMTRATEGLVQTLTAALEIISSM